ncbi:hypothetical protein KP509_22G072400 [Ceratopteris richardii]|uniref:Uncharacterized protein n=1 Tax=Ceratopteris richardii TaxID=49495 RepID=A0A8T2S977_CERRI|nr:hypothetical protein KP509_22G072400 [Ceratopteris richardii]
MQNSACRLPKAILWGCLLITSYFLQVSYCDMSLKYSILPKWVDSYNAEPNVTLRVCYSATKCVGDDHVYSIDDIAGRPDVMMSGDGLDKNASYTMTLLDVDANNPHHPMYKPLLYWMVCDIPGDVHRYQDLGISGNAVKPYVHPHEWHNHEDVFGTHRMYLLLFKQERKIGYIHFGRDVRSLSMRKFTRQFDLHYPVAGACFDVNFEGFQDPPP